LGYRPNLISRSLRTKITRTIALVSDTVATEQYAGQVVNGSLAAALEHRHLLFIGETEGDSRVEARLVQEFLDRQVDGFIYAAMYTRTVRIPPGLRGHPLVLLNCVTKGEKVAAVLPDEVNGGRAAATTLLEARHRDAIYVVGEWALDVFAGRERLSGIKDTLGSAGAQIAGTLACRWWPEPAYDTVAQFLRDGGRPAALICLNDRIALGAYQAVGEAGMAIPRDVSVVSFDDSDLACWLRPRLTSVALPHYELGRRAVELLLAEGSPPGVERVPMPLRERSSVAPPRASRPRSA
jgi:LacI family transcriptional regulator